MIHYDLVCEHMHGFDGWFRDSAAFDMQAERALVACPHCGSLKVRRALMAPRVAKRRRNAAPATIDPSGQPVGAPQPQASKPDAQGPDASRSDARMGAALPDEVRAALQRLRSEVEQRCENVGERFVEEARAIHHGDIEPRPIYGDATPEQAEALADEGVPIARIPWVPRADS